MSMKQIDTLYKYEKDNENKAATNLRQAELEFQQNTQRLESVSEYRLEYMKRLSQRSAEGIDSHTYNHFHAFIKKLDNASAQVEIALNQAKSMVNKRKREWLQQRQKVQAVELLRDKKIKMQLVVENKQEQKMFDEIATQQFVRRNLL